MALTLAISLFYLFYASRLYLYSYISLRQPRTLADPPPGENDWVTVLLPVYNEPAVILSRLLKACTCFNYDRYDVLVADDSDDPETLSVLEDWKRYDRVSVIRRPSRKGFKGGALQNAIGQLGPRTTHLLIFDADFLPGPDVLTSLLQVSKMIEPLLFRATKATPSTQNRTGSPKLYTPQPPPGSQPTSQLGGDWGPSFSLEGR